MFDMIRRHFIRAILFLPLVAVCSRGATSVTLSDVVVARSPSITGRVVDTGGYPVPGVSITVTEARAGIAGEGTSERDGSYRFDALPDGTYRLDFVLPGFELFRWSNVRVRSGVTANADATLGIRGICECVTPARPKLAGRAGQVVDESRRPLPHARLEIVSPTGREVAPADRGGRFTVRVPVRGTWALTATDSGFDAVTQQVSGAVSGAIVFTLWYAGMTDQPCSEQFPCQCPGDLFVHGGR